MEELIMISIELPSLRCEQHQKNTALYPKNHHEQKVPAQESDIISPPCTISRMGTAAAML